uniref:SHSP domain-containing protein n=1 Tax=Romanomermis culicivorax TaxID=13658 RepID=A0A915I9K7_ROMCU
MATDKEKARWDWPLQRNDGAVRMINDHRRFSVDLEVPTFKPHEIDVKVMNDELVVHCSQTAAPGRLPREIHRTYRLPSDVDINSIKTAIGTNGVLQISAVKRPSIS